MNKRIVKNNSMEIKTAIGKYFYPFLFNCCILFSITLQAQQFEWASAGGNLNAGYRASILDSKGNLVVVGDAYLPSHHYGGGSFLYSSSGDSVKINAAGNPMMIISFDPAGKINWKQEIRNGGEPAGVAVNTKKEIIILSDNGYMYSFTEEGKLIKTIQDKERIIKNVKNFVITPDDRLFISGYKVVDTINTKGVHQQIVFTYITCIDENLHVKWEKKIQHETGSTMVPSSAMDIAPNGDIYIGCSILVGASFGKKEMYKAAIVDSISQYHQPYESFIACYNKNGELKWVKRSGGRSIIGSLKATGNGVVIGGTIMNNLSFFGMTADTAGNKKMFLAAFSNKGNISWLKTTTAHSVKAITTDQDQNIYAIVESKIGYPQYMVYERDTLRNVYQTLIIASYTKDGQFRWVKNCKVPMSTNAFPQIKTDACGNIYVSGEMWSIMRSQLNWFDAAFVKGDGYGDGAFVAKLKNTLPPKIAELVSHKKNVCVVSPAPWTIFNYPNPFRGETTIQFKTTYDDPAVSLQVYDLNGQLVATVFTGKPMKAGTHTQAFAAGLLSKGMYVAVLRGLEAVATEKIIVQ
jgi:Secretion system C-terminal sorting domain